MLGQNAGAKAGPVPSKTPAQEKRATHAIALDDDEDERGPKRRLVRDNTEETDERLRAIATRRV
ncbi:unnamed protein product [Callosobruchus maculatus]|uniref:Uncharacterized protein n=1 Tax=Callosobruchus maculatus TaxID=64391 RepID=A0A653DEF7_CALMS|nr:unnamed protein product [Callosobruchus maculatus]